MISYIIGMYHDKKKMLKELRRQKGRIQKLQIEQKALLAVITNLKATIADMEEGDKKILGEVIKTQIQKNRHSAITMERIKCLLESTDIEQIFNNSDILEDQDTLRELIKLVKDVKNDLSDVEFSKKIERVYEENVIATRKRIGWTDETSKEEWIAAETTRYNKERETEEKMIDVEVFNDDERFMKLFEDLQYSTDKDSHLESEFAGNNDEVNRILDNILKNNEEFKFNVSTEIMPTPAAFQSQRKDQFLTFDKENRNAIWFNNGDTSRMAMGLIMGLLICTLLTIGLMKKKQNSRREYEENTNGTEEEFIPRE